MTAVETGQRIPAARRQSQAAVAVWLTAVAVLVFAMVCLGGVTRLTESGLSMVEWQPVTGWLPPLSEAEWQAEFAKYRQFPEYQKLNLGMTLAEFQRIYWFEYAHRLLGRLIGVAFALPFLVFLLAGRLPAGLVPRLVVLFALGGAQGALGWFMVASGLVDRPDVSHYRLTAHLGLAVVIFGALLWTILDLRRPSTMQVSAVPGLRRGALALLALVFVQILAGGLVAGLNAGLIYNTWPLMGGGLAPPDLLQLSPWWLNVFEHVPAVQFVHRMLGYAVVAGAVAFAWAAWRAAAVPPAGRQLAVAAAVAAVWQAVLGVATLLLVVPIGLAALHQAFALILFASVLAAAHTLGRGGR